MVAQGTTLAGRYRLDTRIGAGGMGEVWRGEDIVLARTVAVKVLLPGRMEDPGFVARFQGEARAMATINHSGVVDVYDYGVSGDTVYLVMKFVDGEPLDRLLSRLGRIAPQQAMELIAQAASALQAVHDQGIVHRDVKPGNLLVQRDGTLVLTDFGIARSDLANRLTDAGMVLGTAAYCAPEQAEGAPVTPAVDVYALGVVAYECLMGQRPFDGDSAVTIALKHIREAPPPLPAEIPPAVRTLVEVALSKDPGRRYPSAKAMSEAARAAASGQASPVPEPVQAPPAGQAAPPMEAYQTGAHQQAAAQDTNVSERRGGSRRAAKAPRRTGLITGIAVAVVLGAGAGAVALTGMTPGEPQITETAEPKNNTKPIDPPPKTKTAELPDPEPTTQEPKPSTTRPRPSETRPTREPTRTPTPTPTPSKTPSGTPSGSPTPTAVKKRVPKVVGMRFLDAQEIVLSMGFEVDLDDQTTTTAGLRCGTVKATTPKGGTEAEEGAEVTLVVVDSPCTTGSPSPTPSATPKR
ncbi:serine/threonine protein kinase [Nonomuraea mesophila]|uniref:non-specific serine/threonine protein kinase n=1 Tax=Nonomuraea mesophila TaxID=2530382 RepID=A0A4R5FSA6_9ACTN|nr:serine/threonine protein kinase [Nonomuraea mesophila]TDE56100.1 serine/threonine protein kinase [Nonomuraea mesophila]